MMLTPAEVRRQKAEALAHYGAYENSYHEAGIELSAKIANLRKQCPHENTDGEASQCGAAIFCSDCGAMVSQVGEAY